MSFDRDKGKEREIGELEGGYEKTQANAKGKVGFKMEPPAAAGFEERMQRPQTAVAQRSNKMWTQ